MNEDRPIDVLGPDRVTETAAGMAGMAEVRDPDFDRLYETYCPLLRRIAILHRPGGDFGSSHTPRV